MHLTEREIFSQYKALNQTYNYFMENIKQIKAFKEKHSFKTITYIGSGSGACLCESAEISTKIHMGIPSNSITAGDLMLNFPHYKNVIQDSLIVVPSRSGSTSEVIMAVKLAKEEFGSICVAISAQEDSALSELCDLNLEIPWAFDESVCQTRTVTNLYMANLLLIGIFSSNEKLIEEIKDAIEKGDKYVEEYKSLLKDIGEEIWWERVVVLGDSELQGIANEAAIAFMEIPQIQANYHHILDVRHGPIVLINSKTLVIMASSPYGTPYQENLIKDIKDRGSKVITVGTLKLRSSDYHITVPAYENYGVVGIPFVFVTQLIAYYKAVSTGINPDEPEGLKSWIKLEI